MSDPDQGWKPSGRPQSTMAQAFSSVLDSAFSLDSDVDQISQSIDSRKQQMMIQSRELEALQARIREAEERLARKSNSVGANSSDNGAAKGEDGGYQPTDSNRSMAYRPHGSGQREYPGEQGK